MFWFGRCNLKSVDFKKKRDILKDLVLKAKILIYIDIKKIATFSKAALKTFLFLSQYSHSAVQGACDLYQFSLKHEQITS